MTSMANSRANLSLKVCSKCKVSKSVEEFNFRNRSSGIRHRYCRECGKKLTQDHYRRNKHQYIERSMRATVKRRTFLRQMKSRSCADCGVQYPYYVMDFDHRAGETKVFEMNQVNYVMMHAIQKEIEKCDIVCSNYHRERTYQRIIQRQANRST
jgi:hypothetical protein